MATKRLKYILFSGIILLCFTSCAPMPFLYNVDVKKGTPAGKELNLDKADIMITTVINDSSGVSDSTFIAQIAKGMAERLEYNFDLESESIPVLMISGELIDMNDLYSRLYLMESENRDILIVLDSIDTGAVTYDPEPYKSLSSLGLISVIALDVEAQVKIAIFNNYSGQPVYSERDTMILKIEVPGENVSEALNDRRKLASYLISGFNAYGRKLAEKLSFVWEEESRVIYIDDRFKEWYTAYDYMVDFEFDKAIALWLKYTRSYSPKIMAAAAYNIAVACELSEEYDLAIRWLDQSEKIYDMGEIVDIMRKTIRERVEN